MKKVALYLLVGVSLLGCGSDDSRPGVMPGLPPGGTVPSTPPNQGGSNPNQPPTDSNTPPPNPNDTNNELLSGIYTGTSTWVTGKTYVVNGLVDDNKRFWFINSNSNNSEILGFTNSNENVKGSNGKFSVPGKEYSYEDRKAFDITIEGNYETSKVVEGKTFDLPSNPTTYKVTYDDTLSSKKQTFDMINNKTFIGGAYTTGDTGKGPATIRFNNKGEFTGIAEGCDFIGKLTLSGSERYFNASVNFTSSACFANGETHSGVALLDSDNELIVLGTDTNKSKGTIFNGEMK